MYGLGFGYGAIGATTILKSGGGAAYDADAQAFFTANSTLTDVTLKSAINQLYLDWKFYGVFTTIKDCKLLMLGNSTKTAISLITPASFTNTYSSGWTFGSTGATPNGTSAYADTNFKPITNGSLTANNNHIGIYSQSSNAKDYYNAGSETYPAQNALNIWVRRVGDTAGYDSGIYTTNRNTFANTDGKGYYLGTSSGLQSKFYKNGVLKNTVSITNMSLTDINIYLGSTNPTNQFTDQTLSLYHVGTALTNQQAVDMATCINTFMTTLAINTY
jgi:hypothetical protein